MKVSVKHQGIMRFQIPDVWKKFRLAYYNLHISAELTSYEFSWLYFMQYPPIMGFLEYLTWYAPKPNLGFVKAQFL